jgi:hypothetical protein
MTIVIAEEVKKASAPTVARGFFRHDLGARFRRNFGRNPRLDF